MFPYRIKRHENLSRNEQKFLSHQEMNLNLSMTEIQCEYVSCVSESMYN